MGKVLLSFGMAEGFYVFVMGWGSAGKRKENLTQRRRVRREVRKKKILLESQRYMRNEES
jgi:hypothetical protein